MAKCGLETEVYSRVVGYHRPVRLWNKGKQEEFKDRGEGFKIPKVKDMRDVNNPPKESSSES